MEPAAKRVRKSPVWNFMEQTSYKTVKCVLCKNTLAYNKTTSSMLKHIQSKHPLDYAAQKENNSAESQDSPAALAETQTTNRVAQQTLHDIMTKAEGYKEGGTKKKHLDELLMHMIVADLQPLSIVEDKGFRKFVNGLDPRYVLPSRRDLTRKHLPSMYDHAVKRLKDQLKEASYVSLTTDIWTSRQTRGFITVTAHYISPDWVLKSAVLETTKIENEHTKENIANELTRICTQWSILDKVCCIITDNAANIVAAVTKCMQKQHLPCFAHTLNLVVQDAVKKQMK